MTTMINTKTAVAYYKLARINSEPDIFYITYKEGKEIPLFFGETPYEAFSSSKKHIILDHDFLDDGVNLEWSFYTINKDAIAAKKKENPNQEITRVRLVGFIQNSKQEATAKWNNYYLKMKFFED